MKNNLIYLVISIVILSIATSCVQNAYELKQENASKNSQESANEYNQENVYELRRANSKKIKKGMSVSQVNKLMGIDNPHKIVSTKSKYAYSKRNLGKYLVMSYAFSDLYECNIGYTGKCQEYEILCFENDKLVGLNWDECQELDREDYVRPKIIELTKKLDKEFDEITEGATDDSDLAINLYDYWKKMSKLYHRGTTDYYGEKGLYREKMNLVETTLSNLSKTTKESHAKFMWGLLNLKEGFRNSDIAEKCKASSISAVRNLESMYRNLAQESYKIALKVFKGNFDYPNSGIYAWPYVPVWGWGACK